MKTRKFSSRIIAIITVIAMLAGYGVMSAVAADEASIPASGYAAVGYVDADAHKAEVLLGTGEQGAVYFNGAAPAAGAVYGYTRNSENIYSFTTLVGNNGYGDQLTANGWNTWFTPNGWAWNGNGTVYYPNGNPIFVRFGEDKWAITNIYGFAETNGAAWAYTYALDMVPNGSAYNIGALVVGGLKEDGTIDTTGYDALLPNLTPSADLSAVTADLHENVNTDAIIVETGYAAVGYADTDTSQVEILKGTAEQGYVTYTGTAPAAGAVYSYSRTIHNVYTFTVPAANHGYSNQLDATNAAWQMWANSEYGGYMWDGASNHYWPSASTPIFVRHSTTSWTLTDSSCFVSTLTYPSVMTYALDASLQAGSTNYYNVGALVFGGCKEDGSIDTSGYSDITLPETKINLSELTVALHPIAGHTEHTAGEAVVENNVGATCGAAGSYDSVVYCSVCEEELSRTTVPVPATGEHTDENEDGACDTCGYEESGDEIPGTEGIELDGYAAVGFVDAAAFKAEVLLGDGNKGTVSFTGTAPIAGAVYGYTAENNIYTFYAPEVNGGSGDQLAAGGNLSMFVTGDGYIWGEYAGVTSHFFFSDSAPVFVRFSTTSWAIADSAAFQDSYPNAVDAYILDIQGRGADYPATYYNMAALVINSYNADGSDNETVDSAVGSTAATADLSTLSNTFGPGTEGGGSEGGNEGGNEGGTEGGGTEDGGTAGETVVSGFAAVGYVDTDNKKAEVLLGTGEQGWVTYVGTAPTVGGVYSFNCDANNVFTFTAVSANHGYCDPLTTEGWIMYYTPNGWFWDLGNPTGIYFPVNDDYRNFPIFVRLGDNKWTVIKWADMDEQYDSSVGVKTYALNVTLKDQANNYFYAAAIVLGSLNADGTIDTSGLEMFGNPTATADLSALTNALYPAGDPNAPVYEAEGKVKDTGYAAIGAVDTYNKKVEVLLGNGKQGTVYYAGEAPQSGAVYSYERYANNIFVFTAEAANFGSSDQLADTGWPMWYTPNGWVWDANTPNDFFFPAAENPIFVRFGEDKWALVKLSDIAETNGQSWAYTYVLDPTVRDAENNYYNVGAMVIGGMKSDGSIDTTGFAELLPGVKATADLSEFTKDLYEKSPQTGDSTPISLMIAVMVVSALSVAALVKNRKEIV